MVCAVPSPHFHKHQRPVAVAHNEVHFAAECPRPCRHPVVPSNEPEPMADQVVQGSLFAFIPQPFCGACHG